MISAAKEFINIINKQRLMIALGETPEIPPEEAYDFTIGFCKENLCILSQLIVCKWDPVAFYFRCKYIAGMITEEQFNQSFEKAVELNKSTNLQQQVNATKDRLPAIRCR